MRGYEELLIASKYKSDKFFTTIPFSSTRKRIWISTKPKGERTAIVNQKAGIEVLKSKIAILGSAMLVLSLPTITLASIDVYFSLVDDPEGAIIEELNSARESIDIAMCYFTDRHLANAVIDAHNRGVAVRIYLDRRQKEAEYSKSHYLAKHDISIRYSSNPANLRCRFAIIDNGLVITGSYS